MIDTLLVTKYVQTCTNIKKKRKRGRIKLLAQYAKELIKPTMSSIYIYTYTCIYVEN